MSLYYTKSDDSIECTICPHFCRIKEGKSGICGVRINRGGKTELTSYGVLSACNLDPVEKKPLYHFFPGNNILSAGSYGCNLRCDFCQNYSISQLVAEKLQANTTPEALTYKALNSQKNIGIAFTYNEPVIWFEFMRDVARAVKDAGMFTAIVSNGFVNPEPLEEIIQFTDAFNIDLKAFNSTFYKKLTGAHIEPVKESLRHIAKSGKHLEITTLLIPGHNDNEKEMAAESEWIAEELGRDVPLHLSRYYPMYKRDDPPTPQKVLNNIFNIASANLDYVYMGNTMSELGKNTICPGCGTTITLRTGYNTGLSNLDEAGRCRVCKKLIYRNFTLPPQRGH